MKENRLSLVKKARWYDKAIERAKVLINSNYLYKIFPELDEEGNEEDSDKIREEIISVFHSLRKGIIPESINYSDIFAWLGEQITDDEEIRNRFSFYCYKDDPKILYLSDVFVNEAYREQGIGSKMLQAAENVARISGAESIVLGVKKDSPAEQFYLNWGYKFLSNENNLNWLKKEVKME